MKKVFIKFNPYKIETEVTIDGKKLASNSKISEKIDDNVRLQEWVEELPKILLDECNCKDFEVTFHGTLIDYEDLEDAFKAVCINDGMNVTFNRIPAKETTDKERLIDEIFLEIKNGPFEELKDKAIENSFTQAKSSDFEVCVVANMSAGKSTLINSMIRTKLMPSKMEACTAIITRIKDITTENVPFEAEVFNSNGELYESYRNLTYPVMERLNADSNVSSINVSGNIPFVSSEDVSLIIIDTPGPDNARDVNHRKVQSEYLSKSSKPLVLFMLTGAYGTDEDSTLLKNISEKMIVGGKQSRDRFIFVVNKLDDRQAQDGDIKETLENVRNYLELNGIKNANLFPAGSLPALNIRLMSSGEYVDEDTMDDTKMRIKRLNRNESMHFEQFSKLPPSIKDDISEQLNNTKSMWQGKTFANPDEALIHTGIPSIEAAIKQYVEKYAKTAKIKNIVDTFSHKLEELGCFEEIKKELIENNVKKKELVENLEIIEKKLASVKDAKKFNTEVDDALIKVNTKSIQVKDEVIAKFQKAIKKQIENVGNKELSISECEVVIKKLKESAKELEPKFQTELDKIINSNLVTTSELLIKNYKDKLKNLTKEIDTSKINGVKIDVIKIMSSGFYGDNLNIENITKERTVQDGEEWVENPNKKWFKPWTWLDEDGYTRKKYTNIQYVSSSELARDFFSPLEKILSDTGDRACVYSKSKSSDIAKSFNIEFSRLDHVLKVKLAELKVCATNKDEVELRIRECENKRNWLKDIENKVESILEI